MMIGWRFSIIALTLIPFLISCGTVATLAQSDYQIKHRLSYAGTHCKSLPRTYSGLFYDYCILDSAPNVSMGKESTMMHLSDFVGSGIADTLVLPYTIYLQLDRGCLAIE